MGAATPGTSDGCPVCLPMDGAVCGRRRRVLESKVLENPLCKVKLAADGW